MDVYDDIEEYRRLVQPLRERKTGLRFLVAVHHGAASSGSFCKSENVFRNAIQRHVRDAFNKIYSTGTGLRESMTTHVLRTLVITGLFERRHANSSVALRSGHQDMHSLKAYQNVRGPRGKRQQSDIFTEQDEALKRLTSEERKVRASPVELSNKKSDSTINSTLSPCLNSENLAPEEFSFLSKVGNITGNVTINVHNYRGLYISSVM